MGIPNLFSIFSYLGNIFNIVDLDGSETIEKEEFRQLIKLEENFQYYGYAKFFPNYLSRLLDVGFGFVFHLIDADSSASLDEVEFDRFYDALIRLFFDLMDENGNGSVSFSELNKMCQAVLETSKQKTMTFEQIFQIMSLMDDNSNGEIEYNEYEALIKAYVEPYMKIWFTMFTTLKKHEHGTPSESAWKKHEDMQLGILAKLFE